MPASFFPFSVPLWEVRSGTRPPTFTQSHDTLSHEFSITNDRNTMGLRGLLGCLRPATFKAVDTPLNSENPSGVSQEPAASAFIANVAVPDEVGASEVADQRRSQSLELAKSSSGQRLLLLGSNTGA